MDGHLLRLQILELKEEFRTEQIRREVAEARIHRIIENMRNCIQSLGDRDICRNSNCRTDFDCYIEQKIQKTKL